MTDLHGVTPERHASKFWLRTKSMEFADKDSVIALGLRELPQAMMAMSIGFMKDGDGFVLIGIMGLTAQENLFVAKGGKWLATYLPATYRYYPFRQALNSAQEKVLCIDEDSGLVNDVPGGERFFDADGKPAESLKDVVRGLGEHEQDKITARQICALLDKHGLIQSWPVQLQREGQTQAVEGLYRIDESALNALNAEALLELRNGGALMAAYSQLFSMQHLSQLGKLAAFKSQASASSMAAANAADRVGEHGVISFENL